MQTLVYKLVPGLQKGQFSALSFDNLCSLFGHWMILYSSSNILFRQSSSEAEITQLIDYGWQLVVFCVEIFQSIIQCL